MGPNSPILKVFDITKINISSVSLYLVMNLKVQLSDWSRLDQAVNFYFLIEFSEKIRILFWEKFSCVWIIYGSVNYNVANMNTSRPQLPGQRLRQCSLGHLEGRVSESLSGGDLPWLNWRQSVLLPPWDWPWPLWGWWFPRPASPSGGKPPG